MHLTNIRAIIGVTKTPEGFVMTITTVGIDLAKNAFAAYSIDQNGKTVLFGISLDIENHCTLSSLFDQYL